MTDALTATKHGSNLLWYRKGLVKPAHLILTTKLKNREKPIQFLTDDI